MNICLYISISLCVCNVYIYTFSEINGNLLCIFQSIFFPHLALYSGDHSIGIHRDIPHSFLQLHSISLFECSTLNSVSPLLMHILVCVWCYYINICSCFCVSVSIYLGQISKSRLPGSKGQSAHVILLDIAKFPFIRFVPVYIPSSNDRNACFSKALPKEYLSIILIFATLIAEKQHISIFLI